jgi:starch synthase (maltosyl-transferring)
MDQETSVLERPGDHGVATVPSGVASPRIYYVHPLLAGPLECWPTHLDRAAAAGFTHILLAPPFRADSVLLAEDFDRPHSALNAGDDALAALGRVADLSARAGLVPLLDVMLDGVAAGGATAARRPDIFRAPDPARWLDPRFYTRGGTFSPSRFDDAAEATTLWWRERLAAWLGTGLRGFRFVGLGAVGPAALRALTASVHAGDPSALALGWTLGLGDAGIDALVDSGLDHVFAPLPGWDFRDERFWTALARLRRVARVLLPVEAPFGARLGRRVIDPAHRAAARRRAAWFAATVADGWLMPMGFEYDAIEPFDPRRDTPADLPTHEDPALPRDLREANAAAVADSPARPVSTPGADVLAVLRDTTLIAVNTGVERPAELRAPPMAANLMDEDVLAPGEVRLFTMRRPGAIVLDRPPLSRTAAAAARAPRIAIENVAPSVDAGRFAAKRVVGETVRVTADIVCDGHDQLAVALLWRAADATEWRETRMRPLGNDVWTAGFTPDRVGRWQFTIEAWRDSFATWRDEVSKKRAAGVDLRLELIEGLHLVQAAASRSPEASVLADELPKADVDEQCERLLHADTAALMARADARPFAVRLAPPCPLDADRLAARFASWYEIFPRSMSDDPARHGTFRDVIRHLPRIRDMGFDVLYFPPIHPIGRRNRKGRNNARVAAEGDPGSPYAIGSAEGGHDAIHPELGTLDDFLALREAAAAHGLELALDFAVQCAPDHPWLTRHPDWFDWRSDGSMRYAENPPKKYEDIVNVDFYGAGAVPDLWVALCDVVMFWAEQGVRIFRVDNPHTKPLPFWEWLIAQVRSDYPDTLFLAEAFTRPKVMNRLGKLGFTQSYTYFTWRNTKRALQDYLTELTTPPVSDFFRPNFFVNTPDINPPFLQTGGRPAHLIRAALAATLSGLWGVYSGFELCETAAVPGREEYLDSEKYQIRAWDWRRPGNIVAEIAALNRLRARNPALRDTMGLTFLPAANEQVLFYEKATPERDNVVLVAVSLDPFGAQTAAVELPQWHWKLPDAAALLAEDLMSGATHTWNGKWQSVTLTPETPFRIWRVSPA